MNLRDLSAAELTTLKSRILSELQARRRAAKPRKARKPVDREAAKRAERYEAFRRDRCDRCWICGRTENDGPDWWHGVFFIERMHIASSPRVEDIRVIIAGCSLCHRIQHGDRFTRTKQKPLTLAELLGVKLDNDPEGFDLEFIQAHSVGRLPEPAPPTATYPRERNEG